MSAPTINQTTFARFYMEATTLVLDAIAVIGEARRTKLTEAQDLVYKAIASQITPAEQVLAQQLNQTIKYYERNGMAW